jgi:hypothetical protein
MSSLSTPQQQTTLICPDAPIREARCPSTPIQEVVRRLDFSTPETQSPKRQRHEDGFTTPIQEKKVKLVCPDAPKRKAKKALCVRKLF